ncbi:MAG TPA: hypothetical protein VG604_02440 [Candidatus Saccharimonadales bacterium]|nr:hypothetical protein [Candidatus Saccharimonadales bacterium]
MNDDQNYNPPAEDQQEPVTDDGMQPALDDLVQPQPQTDDAAASTDNGGNNYDDWQHPGVPLDQPYDNGGGDPAAQSDQPDQPQPAPEEQPNYDQPQPEEQQYEQPETEPAFDANPQAADEAAQQAEEPAQPEPAPISDVMLPGQPFAQSPGVPLPDNNWSDTPGNNPTADLLALKNQTLQELAPMVDDLKQTPEEHFHTLMMMIQASDDQSLLPKAHDAAKAIEDEETRAQALLDVVNEINYFTQPHDQDNQAA